MEIQLTDGELSEKQQVARDSLPEDLRLIFDSLVAEYRYAATVRHGAPYVSYIVLADLVRVGWRHTAAPVE